MSSNTKTDPYPVKLDWATKDVVTKLKSRTGLSRSEILRRAVRYAAPLFLSGQVSIADVGGDDAPKKTRSNAA